MGAKALVILSVLVACIGIGVIYFNPDLSLKYPFVKQLIDSTRERVVSYAKGFLKDDKTSTADVKETGSAKPKSEERLLTPAELRKYDGSPESLGLYLGLLGKVYDVQSGSQHYRPGGGYSFFAGRDASRAYLTGDFKDDLNDKLSDLADDVVFGINSWVDLYEKDYKYIGKLVGTYYDQDGKPTAQLLKVQEAIERGNKGKKKEQDEKVIFPPCNSEWSQESGGRVWCTKQSGGINRDWVGVPRQLMSDPSSSSSKQPRCACVKATGPPSFVPKVQPATIDLTRGDLDHPHLKEYADCPPTSESCPLERAKIPLH